jgi:hypothetical protein
MHAVGSLFHVHSPLIHAIGLDRRAGRRAWRHAAGGDANPSNPASPDRDDAPPHTPETSSAIKAMCVDQGRTHAEKRSNHVRLRQKPPRGRQKRRAGG